MSCADEALAVIECIAAGIISVLIMAALGAIIKIPGRLSDIKEEIRKSTKEKRG